MIRDARDGGRKALEILRQSGVCGRLHVARREIGYGLRDAEEVISDALLIAMVLKGLPTEYNTCATVIVQREKQMTFAEFKSALRSHEESAKTLDAKTANANENVMFAKQKFDGNCFKCGRKGHKSSECLSRTEKWCSN